MRTNTRYCIISIALLLGSITTFALGALSTNGNHQDLSAFRRTLQGACVPQQYPKQGALLSVTIQGRILDLVWPSSGDTSTSTPVTSETHKHVYAVVSDVDGFPGGPLWRSDYHGKADSWKDVTPQLAAALPANDSSAHSGVLALHWHPSRPETVLFQGRGRYHWVTKDAGATYSALPTPGNTVGFNHEIKLHPRQADWMLAKARRDTCTADFRAADCAADLWVSKDFGATWQNLTEASGGTVAGVRDYDWGAKLPMFAGKPTPDGAIFATVYPGTAAHRGLYPGWDKDLHYVVTLDLFASPLAKIIPCGNLFEVLAGKVFLAVPSDCPAGPDGKQHKAGSGTISSRSVTMYVSDGDGDEFVEACLPAGLEDDGYNLVHTHDGAAAFVLADHAEPGSWSAETDAPTSDAYAPAYNASLHTMALSDVYRRDFVTDFSRVEGLPGMYIANQLDPAAKTASSRGREASFLRTRLTTDGGASWQALKPPTSFRYGQCNSCPPGASPEQCSLHLHGPTSWFAPEGPHPNFYSLPYAPGLILATGNVGHHLDLSPDGDCTWMSRDGGLTWEDVADNTAIYEVGNFGAIVAMAPHRSEGPTDTVVFSIDQGGCFHKVKLPESILVDNIRVAPGGAGHIFLVHGTACLRTEAHPTCGFTGGSAPGAKMYSIDVQELLAGDWKECDTKEDSTQYETWTAPSSDLCLLGAKRTMRRRTRDAYCFNPLDWQVKLEKGDMCACGVEHDVECEFGWMRGVNNTCVEMQGLSVQDACPRLSSSGYRTSSSHLRLVHGNVCKDVNAVIPDTNGRGGAKGSNKPGGGGSGGGGSGGGGGGGHSAVRSFFVFILVCGALAVAGGLTWMHCLNQGQRSQLASAAAPALGAVAAALEMGLGVAVEAYDWCRSKFRSLLGQHSGVSYFEGGSGYEPLGGGGSGGGRGLDMLPEEDDYRSPAPLGP